jgi:predicted ferric reductase
MSKNYYWFSGIVLLQYFIFDQVFGKISQEKKGKVKVFFCGAPQLGQIVKKACMKFNFKFRKEEF